MSTFTRFALWYFAAISVFTAGVTVADKLRARCGKWRIKEATLLALALAGGSAAEFVTMLLIHHKTQHNKFMLGLPLICIAQGIAVLGIDIGLKLLFGNPSL